MRRPSSARRGRVACPTRGMTKNMTPAKAKVPAAATRDIRKSGLPGPMPLVVSSAAPILARSDSPAKWCRINIQVPRTRKATKTKRKLTLKVTAEETQQDEKEEQMHHAVEEILREVKQVDTDGEGRGGDERPSEYWADGHAVAHLIDGPAADESQGEDDPAERVEQSGEKEGSHPDADEEVRDEAESEERGH